MNYNKKATQVQETVNEFLHKYGIIAKRSTMRQPEPYRFMSDDLEHGMYKHYIQVKDVPAVELLMSEKSFNDLVDVEELAYDLKRRYGPYVLEEVSKMYETHYNQVDEAKIRNSNPAVKKAWENYKLLLKIAGG